MGDKTGIEWTDATWNPIVGCSVVSPGCTNCYAMKQASRMELMGVKHYAGLTKSSKAGPVWTGKLAQAPDALLLKPIRQKRPRRIFVNSMSDLFHEDVPEVWIDRVFAVMALAPQHTFQVLTKRSKRMLEYMVRPTDGDGRFHVVAVQYDIMRGARYSGYAEIKARWPLPNVWLGVSAEDQTRADERIPDLLATPAAVRFVSAEPLLGPINRWTFSTPGWDRCDSIDALTGGGRSTNSAWLSGSQKLDWVIVGGESQAGARPMHPDWARKIRDDCAAAGVPFLFKQWGEWAPTATPMTKGQTTVWPNGRSGSGNANDGCGAGREMNRVGKARAGRLLDGREHNDLPWSVA